MGGRVTPKGTHPASRIRPQPSNHDEPDLIRKVRLALGAEHPLELLALASSLLAMVDARRANPFERARGVANDQLSRAELIHTLLGLECVETSALLSAMVAMSDDELERARIRKVLAGRGGALPEWLAALDIAEAYSAIEMTHILGDGDDIIVGVRLADAHELSVLVYIDHNLGTLAKDAFVVGEPLEDLVLAMKSAAEDPDTSWNDLDLAEARKRITDAIDRGAMTYPPFESDTWPACQPLIEWACRLMPTGGVGYVRPEWDDDALDTLKRQFLSSPFAATLQDPDFAQLLDSVLWFATGYGPGDPLRWSPVAVEILLDDWIPRKIVAPATFLAKAPELLRAFVAFSQEQRDIRPELRRETLAAIDAYEPDYQRTIRTPRPQGPAALLAAMGVFDPDGPWQDNDPELEYWEIMLEALARAVGTEENLSQLDVSPLPEEPFDWTGIAEDVRPRVEEVLELSDRCCDQLLDAEYRCACRRLLELIAKGDPEVFRRKARADTAAAAVCWIVGKDNDLFGPSPGGLLVKDLMAHFGIHQGGVSQRAATFLKAAGFDYDGYGEIRLGSPRLLVSARRRHIVELRDRYNKIAKENT
jgi:hypothetical protein